MEWNDSKTAPPRFELLICYCPEWCGTEYQVCVWTGREFTYDEQPNDMFSGLVEKWALFDGAE